MPALTEKEFNDAMVAFRPNMVRIALKRLRNEDAAEDAVQEASLRALVNRDKFVEGGATGVRKWLTVILVNLIKGGYKRAQRIVYTDDPNYADGMVSRDDPHKTLEAKQALEVVEQLPTCWSEPLKMLAVGMEYVETARALGIPEGSLKSGAHRARAAMREIAGAC